MLQVGRSTYHSNTSHWEGGGGGIRNEDMQMTIFMVNFTTMSDKNNLDTTATTVAAKLKLFHEFEQPVVAELDSKNTRAVLSR